MHEDAAARRGDGQVGLGLAEAGDVGGELGDLRAHQAQFLGALLGVRAFELARQRQLAFGLLAGDHQLAVLDAGDQLLRLLGLARGFIQLGDRKSHTSELQSLMRISYAVFCLKKKKYRVSITTLDSINTKNNTYKITT